MHVKKFQIGTEMSAEMMFTHIVKTITIKTVGRTSSAIKATSIRIKVTAKLS